MLRSIGRYGIFLFRVVERVPYIFRRPGLLLAQVYKLGVLSLPMVLFTSVFVGIVTALQTAYQMERGIPDFILGSTAARIIMIELAPVIMALVVAGRVGSYIAAEIGSMRVTEQVDALESLAIDPLAYICLPRFLASVVALPLLVIIAEVIAIASAGVSCQAMLGVNLDTFIYGVRRYFYLRDLLGGLTKTLFFGIMIGLSGTFSGMRTGQGAEGVGAATTRAVVTASALILAFDFFVAFQVFR